ncbi:MAG TPA: hypothetical protein VL120_14205 [Solirubrobacteraceae bacterium]|jgi:hypothetical protein|nr:hypothetical protein [Solirubrobacteraceae bacterium]
MAQTKKKRRSKHRGNAAGVVEQRSRAGHRRPEVKLTDKQIAAQKRKERMLRPPTWKSAAVKAAAAAALLFVLGVVVLKETIGQALSLTVFVFAFYVPLGYYTDTWIYNRRMRSEAKAKT